METPKQEDRKIGTDGKPYVFLFGKWEPDHRAPSAQQRWFGPSTTSKVPPVVRNVAVDEQSKNPGIAELARNAKRQA